MSSTLNMTTEQYRWVLTEIASRMGTLNELLMRLQQETNPAWSANLFLNAAQEAAEVIGAMADDAIQAEVYGDMRCWLYGPSFKNAGKEGAAA